MRRNNNISGNSSDRPGGAKIGSAIHRKTTLDNGLRIVTQTVPRSRSICLNFFVGAGGRYEDTDLSGLSHYAEHLFFKGTAKRQTTREISETIESVGGILNGATDREMTIYWAKVARPYFSIALELMADILRNSRFDNKDVEKERVIITEEISAALDSPQERVSMLIDEVIWPGQPIGKDVAGTRETVSRIGRQHILDYTDHQYVPNNIVVSISGDIEHRQAVSMIDASLKDWMPGNPRHAIAAHDNQKAPNLRIEERNSEQTHICLAVKGCSNVHPDRYIIDMINVILGQGMSSRLFTAIREDMQLAYDVHSYVTHFSDTGALTVYAGVDPDQTEKAIEALLGELVHLRDKPVPQSELNKAKEMSKGRMLIRMEDTGNIAMWLGGQELLKKRVISIDEAIAKIDSITVDDIYRVAQDIFVTGKLNAAIVGDVHSRQNIEKMLVL